MIVNAGINLSRFSILSDIQLIPRITRIQIAVILINKGYTFNSVAGLVGCSVATVTRSIKRMSTTWDLTDLPRSGRPAVYSETFKLELTGFYCQTQPFPNSGRWILRWAAVHLAADPGIVNAAPGKSTIQRILKENNLKPHQSRYFLNITDPDFFPKMEHLIQLYLKPPKNLFFFDECPGIQILKRLVPDLRTKRTAKRLEEFEYIRNGTMNVLAFFNHANGKVHAECQADHKTDTFLATFRRHVSSCPTNETVHYVMDNLSTHRGYPFCKTVAELSGIDCPTEKKLDNLKKRVEWLKSTDKRIVIHFTPYHGSWLNLIEFWFGIMNKKVSNGSYGSPEELKKSFEAFFEEWNTLLAHPFKWSYDGKGLHKKAVNRFTEMLKHAANKLEISTLTKQLRLAGNLFDYYFLDVPVEDWEKLFIALQSQEATVRNSILNENGLRKKQNAENALNALFSTLEDHFR